MKRYFLGLAAGIKHPFRFLFARGNAADSEALVRFLEKKYKGAAYLYKNGRTALAVALKQYLPEGARVLVNGFTCYAVIEAVKAAKMTPVFVDISPENLNFDFRDLSKKAGTAQGIIIQNTLGNPVDIAKIEKFAHQNKLIIIEDLAHSAGILYPDGREAGTVGDACILSFGKDKVVDTILGGAVILRGKKRTKAKIPLPTLKPRTPDNLRARLYPAIGLLCRKLTKIKLGGFWMKLALKLHLVEKSADNRVDFEHQIANFEAKEALKQLQTLKNQPLRQFFLVENRDQVLKELKRAGYFFDAFWYEVPVSPTRYFKKSGFVPEDCPVATEVSKHILNFPNYYSEQELLPAQKIVEQAQKWDKRAINSKTEHNASAVLNSEKRSNHQNSTKRPIIKTLQKGQFPKMNKEQLFKTYPEANFLQSPEYGEMVEIIGNKVITAKLGQAGYAQMVVRDAKRGRYLEIACGPLLDWQNQTEVKVALDEIRQIAKREKCVFVRIRPQLLNAPENLQILEQNGLKKSPMHLAAEHTVIINLEKSEEELLRNMRRQTRYEVRRSEKLGITVEKSNSEAIFKEFHAVQTATAKRQNFVPPSLKTLLAEREALNSVIYVAKTSKTDVKEDNETPPLLAGQPIAYGLIIKAGNEADYYEAASTELNRKLPGAYALLWQAMKDLKKEGYTRFNLWGIAPPNQPHHRYAGVTTFKTGFGGEIVEFVPAHDLIISRTKYLKNWLVETARKKRRHL